MFVFGLLVAGFFSGSLVAMLYVLRGELRDIGGAHVGTMAGVMLSMGNVGATATAAYILSALGIQVAALYGTAPLLLWLALVAKLRFGEGHEKPSTIATELRDRTQR